MVVKKSVRQINKSLVCSIDGWIDGWGAIFVMDKFHLGKDL